MVKDGDVGPGPSEISDSTEIEIPTTALVQSKIRQYFDIDVQLDLEKVLREGFGLSEGDRTIRVYSEQIPHDAQNPWGIVLRSVTYDQDQGTYKVILDSLANPKTRRIERVTHITLKERNDKSLYYLSVKYEYPKTEFVEITGDYVTLRAEDFGAKMTHYESPAAVVGSGIGGKLLLRADRSLNIKNPYSDIVTTFSIYDPRENRVERQFEIPETKTSLFHGVRILPDKLIFKMTDSFFVTTLDLGKIDSTRALPDVIRKALADTDYITGYDVSADLRKIVFTNRNGLYIHDLDSGLTTKFASHIPVQSDLFDKAYIMSPHFSVNDKAIIAMLSGYEGYYGVMALNLQHPDKPYIQRNPSILSGVDWTNVMYPLVHMQLGARKALEIERINLEALSDPSTKVNRDIREIIFQDEESQQPIDSIDNIPMYNGRYLAYVATGYAKDNSHSAEQVYPDEQIYHIVRVDLETMKAETILSLKAGMPYIRALTGDGQVLFSYHFEREMGLALTGE